MPILWLTYAWLDNEDADIDFVAHRLEDHGIDVRLDRNQLLAGRRLWEQVAEHIARPDLDAWAIFATANSLASEPCQEELAYALDRALRTRGASFPLIGIFPAPMERELIPSSIATRLYVNLKDPKWASRVADGVLGISSQRDARPEEEYFKIHNVRDAFVYEVRPRDGYWHPARIAVLESEAALVRFVPYIGPKNSPQFTPAMFHFQEGSTADHMGRPWKVYYVQEQLDSTRSLYLRTAAPLSHIGFGGSERLKVFPL